jgi:hypothetical protein
MTKCEGYSLLKYNFIWMVMCYRRFRRACCLFRHQFSSPAAVTSVTLFVQLKQYRWVTHSRVIMSSSMILVPSCITSTELISTSQQDYETLKSFSITCNETSIRWSHHRACRGCSPDTASVMFCVHSASAFCRRISASKAPLKMRPPGNHSLPTQLCLVANRFSKPDCCSITLVSWFSLYKYIDFPPGSTESLTHAWKAPWKFIVAKLNYCIVIVRGLHTLCLIMTSFSLQCVCKTQRVHVHAENTEQLSHFRACAGEMGDLEGCGLKGSEALGATFPELSWMCSDSQRNLGRHAVWPLWSRKCAALTLQ